MNRIVKPMPTEAEHAPLSVLNTFPQGIRTMVACSCEWAPSTPPMAATTRQDAHMAHRRAAGLPRADYSKEVFGQGPWMGLTWNEWYAEHGSDHVDPYTGQPDRL